MAKNTGDVDRTARLLLGGAVAILLLAQLPAGLPTTLGRVVGVATLYLMSTALLGWDPFYMVLRLSTRSPNDVNPVSPPAPKSPPTQGDR